MKPTASLIICAVLLLAVSPSRAYAQTRAQPALARTELLVGGARPAPKPRLKELFAEEVAKNKAGTVSAADVKRLEKGWLDPQSTPKHSSGFSKKNAFLAVVIVVVIVGLAIVLEHNGVESVVRCEDDPGAPDCVQ